MLHYFCNICEKCAHRTPSGDKERLKQHRPYKKQKYDCRVSVQYLVIIFKYRAVTKFGYYVPVPVKIIEYFTLLIQAKKTSLNRDRIIIFFLSCSGAA
jgi:hypothetical protein